MNHQALPSRVSEDFLLYIYFRSVYFSKERAAINRTLTDNQCKHTVIMVLNAFMLALTNEENASST